MMRTPCYSGDQLGGSLDHMMRLRSVRAAALLIVFCQSPPLTAARAQERPDIQPQCIVERVRLCDQCVHTRRASVQKNGVCIFEMSGGAVGAASMNIIVPPRYGILGRAAGSAHAYRPKVDFTGEDFFEVSSKWRNKDRDMSMTLRTQVKVMDGPLSW